MLAPSVLWPSPRLRHHKAVSNMPQDMTFDDLATMAYEAMDGIDEKQLVKILRVQMPGIKIRWSAKADAYVVTIPE